MTQTVRERLSKLEEKMEHALERMSEYEINHVMYMRNQEVLTKEVHDMSNILQDNNDTVKSVISELKSNPEYHRIGIVEQVKILMEWKQKQSVKQNWQYGFYVVVLTIGAVVSWLIRVLVEHFSK
jgi:predicted small metal-binding protein